MNNDNCIIDKILLILYSDVAIQRFHRAACTVPMQFKGLGVPNKYFCNAKMVFVYTKTLLAGAMKPLNMLSKI